MIKTIECSGPWPLNAVSDINNARSLLAAHGDGELILRTYLFCWTPINVRVSSHRARLLNLLLPKTTVSYRRFLEKNKLAKIIIDETLDDDLIIASFKDDIIHIIDHENHPLEETEN